MMPFRHGLIPRRRRGQARRPRRALEPRREATWSRAGDADCSAGHVAAAWPGGATDLLYPIAGTRSTVYGPEDLASQPSKMPDVHLGGGAASAGYTECPSTKVTTDRR